MPPSEKTFLGPTAEAVEAALADVVQQANYRAQKGKLTPDPAAYSACAAEMLSRPAGVRVWIGGLARPEDCRADTLASLVGAAWWTDHLGRKHARVVGRRLERGDQFHQRSFGPRSEVRPPAWLVHPDRLVFRARPGQPKELLAVCGCGAIGTPAQLGWTGRCCGPCHDRQQEGGAEPPAGPPLTLAGHLGAAFGVGFHTSGKTIVSTGWGSDERYVTGQLIFWDALTGKARRTVGHDYHMSGMNCLPFACNGKLVAVDGHDEFCVFDARSGKQVHRGGGMRGDELALSADGTRAALRRLDGVFAGRLDGDLVSFDDSYDSGDGRGLAFTPDGRSLIVGLYGGFLLDDLETGIGERIGLIPKSQGEAVAVSPDGRFLLLAAGPSSEMGAGRPVGVPSVVCLWDVAAKKKVADLPEHAGEVRALAFSPDGKFAVAAGYDRVIRFWDIAASAAAGELDWHVGAVNALAFSPDGQWLASASADGLVRLWPWRQLLAA
jgi:hypothetical protein